MGTDIRVLVGSTVRTIRKSSAQSFSTLTLENVTGMVVPVASGQTVYFKYYLRQRAAATTTGFKFNITGPAGATLTAEGMYSRTATSVGSTRMGDISDTSLGVSIPGLVTIIGECVNGVTAGSITLQIASEVDASAVTLDAGSRVEYHV